MNTKQAAMQTPATGRCCGCGLVERIVPPGGLIKDQVVFPSPEAALVPRPLGYVRGCALLRLTDGTIWMLAMPGKAWTRGRVLSAAHVLSEASTGAPGDAERRIRQLPGLEGVTVDAPRLGAPDPKQWDIPGIAAALVARRQGARGTGPSPCRALNQTPSVEETLRRELTAALRDFVAGMDTEVLAAASAGMVLDLARYNYLVRNPFRAFRLQFAATFPSLVPTAIAGGPGTLGAELRTIVDRAGPLVKGLAARWGVRPGVVRHLVGRSSALLGTLWESKPRELAVLLNALRPEDVPADSPHAWGQFNQAVAIGRVLFRKPVWQSPPTLEWLRECIHHTRRGSEQSRLRWLPDQAALAEIARFRDALTRSLLREAGGVAGTITRPLSVACDEVLDRFFARSADQGLGIIARDYQLALTDLHQRQRETRARAVRVGFGEEMWPLIPGDFAASSGRRRIRPLTTYGELTTHGTALGNCLGRGYATRYLSKGPQGTDFVVGVFEYATGTPCSTAEIALKRYPETHSYDLVLVQHTAEENTEPSPDCAEALGELLRYCRSPAIRRHLEDGWRLIGARGAWNTWQRADPVDPLATVRAALRGCLGDQTYDNLLEETLRTGPTLGTHTGVPKGHFQPGWSLP